MKPLRFSAIALLLLTLVAPATPQTQEPRTLLFPDPNAGAMRLQESSDPLLLRVRPMRADLTALEGMSRGDTLSLPLFDDAVFTARAERVWNKSHGITWTGSIDGHDFATATLATVDGILAGHVTTLDSLYEIRVRLDEGGTPVADSYLICQIDPGALPPDGEPIPAPPGAAPLATDASKDARLADKVRILVFYTKAAQDAAGGAPAIKAEIETLIADTNTALKGAKAGFSVELAKAQRIKGTEIALTSGYTGDDLGPLRSTTDNMYKKAHKIRNREDADYVMLIVTTNVAPTACGTAYLMSNQGAAFKTSAFGVSLRRCISNRTPTHELGHNWGGCHDPESSPSCVGTFPYSFGHVAGDDSQRTVMALGSSCASCPRITIFSSKKATFDGGQKAGSKDTDLGRALKKMRKIILNMFEGA